MNSEAQGPARIAAHQGHSASSAAIRRSSSEDEPAAAGGADEEAPAADEEEGSAATIDADRTAGAAMAIMNARRSDSLGTPDASSRGARCIVLLGHCSAVRAVASNMRRIIVGAGEWVGLGS